MSTNGITQQVEDAITYPILTRAVDDQIPTESPSVSSTGTGSLQNVAQNTIRRVLGWRYRANDIKGFSAALTKTFSLKEIEGHVEWEWKPQNYMVQADLGEVTGAQASIYSRAKVALDQVVPLLDGLTPLREDADPEDCEAIRSIIRNELKDQLVPELGKAGGPRVQLVNQVFRLLLGPDPVTQDPENVNGQLKELKNRFGLERKYVNTVDEEVTLTNFLIVVDYINSLYNTWQDQAKSLGRQDLAQPFLGTQLVLLSQQFEVVAESVRQAYDAMDSVFFGPAERETTQLSLDGEPWITVAELLKWVEDSATVVFPQLIQDGGKDGVVVVSTTADRLYGLVDEAWQQSRSPSNNPARGFHTARTQRAFEEIRSNLERTRELAGEIPPIDQTPTSNPKIVNVDPDHGPRKPTSLTITVKDLKDVAKAYLLPKNPLNVISDSYIDQSKSEVTADFDLGHAELGSYTLILETKDHKQVSLEAAFTIQAAAPKITSVEPSTSDQEDMVRLDIGGTGFQQNATVTLELLGSNYKPYGEIVFLSDTKIVAEFDLSLMIEGDWNLVVTNPDGQKNDPYKFKIALPPPVIQSFVPAFGTEGIDLLPLTVRGQHFRSGMTVALQTQCGQTQIDCDDATVVGNTIVKAKFRGSKLTAGEYYVIVTNPGLDNQSAWSEHFLEICKGGPLKVTSVDVSTIDQEDMVRFDIGGTGFQRKATVTLELEGSNRKPYGEIVFLSDTQIVAEFDLSLMIEGKWNLVVTNPDGQKSDPFDDFQIRMPPPAIRSFVPRFATEYKDLEELWVRGRHFRPKMTVALRTQCAETSISCEYPANVVGSNLVIAKFKASNLTPPGQYYVIVTNSDKQSAWSEELLEICGEKYATEDEVRRIAHMLYLQRGQKPGHDEENWRDAVRLWEIMHNAL